MFPRIREIVDPFSRRLRLAIERHPAGALVTLDRPDVAGTPRVTLDGYGVDVVAGFVMAARLALPDQLADEQVDGRFPATLSLVRTPAAAIRIRQEEMDGHVEIPAPAWDKLYAELCLVSAHARELGRRRAEHVH